MRHGQTDGDFSVSQRLAAGASLSGNERNHLFLNCRGRRFVERSGIAGADSPADGRAFAPLDFDNDGWLDLALVSANTPFFQLFRNQLGRSGATGRILSIRLIGGNATDRPTDQWSNRDGYGARITLELAPGRIIRELRAGEGFSAQHPATLRVGLGEVDRVATLHVDWPSGRNQRFTDIAAQSLITIYENPAAAPNGNPLFDQPYGAARLNPQQGARYP